MINLNFSYLLESSFCLLLFMIIYRWLISGLTHFAWMRFYLLTSLVLSLVLPFVIIPFHWNLNLIPAGSFSNPMVMQAKQTLPEVANNNLHPSRADEKVSIVLILFYSVFAVYVVGVFYKLYLFAGNLINIYKLVKKSSKVKEEKYWIVDITGTLPAFSFFNYIFIIKPTNIFLPGNYKL